VASCPFSLFFYSNTCNILPEFFSRWLIIEFLLIEFPYSYPAWLIYFYSEGTVLLVQVFCFVAFPLSIGPITRIYGILYFRANPWVLTRLRNSMLLLKNLSCPAFRAVQMTASQRTSQGGEQPTMLSTQQTQQKQKRKFKLRQRQFHDGFLLNIWNWTTQLLLWSWSPCQPWVYP